MGRKPPLPRTCGCASRGRYRCSCPEAAPSQRASYEALSPTKRARLEYIRDHVVKHRANVKMMIFLRHIPSAPHAEQRVSGLEHEGGGEGGGEGDSEGESGEDNDGAAPRRNKAWRPLEDRYLRLLAADTAEDRSGEQLPGRDAGAVKRRMSELRLAAVVAAEAAPRPPAARPVPASWPVPVPAPRAPPVPAPAPRAPPVLPPAAPPPAASRLSADPVLVFRPEDPLFR